MSMWIKSLNKIKPECIFLIIGLFWGLVFLITTPIFRVPDEAMHLLRTCEVANFVIHNDKHGDFSKDFLPNRKIIVKNNCSNFQYFRKFNHYTNLFEFKNLNYTHNNSGYPCLIYIPSAIGLKLSSLVTTNPFIQFYSGRFFNLLFWILLTFTSIKLTPIFKWSFLVCALFPMTIYEGMSLSADSINFGFAFLYIAFIFKLAYGNKKIISDIESITLIILSLLTVLTKGLFILTLLTFLIPADKFKYKYQNLITILLTFTFQYFFSTNSFILTANSVDISERKELLLNSPFYVIKLIFFTILHKTTFYIQSSIFRLGWLDIEPNPIAVISLFLCFLISVTMENFKLKLFNKLIAFLVSFIFILLTIMLYFLTFTPLESNIIIGIQGRYFIPLYPIFTIILANNLNFRSKTKCVIKLAILFTIIINLSYALYLILNS